MWNYFGTQRERVHHSTQTKMEITEEHTDARFWNFFQGLRDLDKNIFFSFLDLEDFGFFKCRYLTMHGKPETSERFGRFRQFRNI